MFVKQDKLLHLLSSFFIASWIGWWSLIPAVGKEVYDYLKDVRGETPWRWRDSLGDLAADFLGIGLALVLRILLQGISI